MSNAASYSTEPLGQTVSHQSTDRRTMSATTALDRLNQHIANLSIAFVNAINDREWDSPLWENVATDFTSKPEALSGSQSRLNGRDAFIDSVKKLSTAHTSWKINIQSMTVNLSDDHTCAEVFTNSIATGEPVGIARPAMTRLEYRLVKNKWCFISHEIMPGQGGDLMGVRDGYYVEL